MAETCSEPGCDRPAAKGGRCWGHVKQLQRYGRTFRLGAMHSLRTQLEEAAVVYVLADDADRAAFEKARSDLASAARSYVLSTARKWLKNEVRRAVLSTADRMMAKGRRFDERDD